jgi:hypothetical protein
VVESESRPEIDDYIWSDLLDFIESGRVVAIVDALQLAAGPGAEPLEAGIARGLAQRVGVALLPGPRPPRLDDVVSLHVARGQSKVVLYPRLLGVLKDLASAPPPALRDLAAIGGLRLFVSVSPDGLLQRAIDEQRFGGQPRCTSVTYAPNRIADLPLPMEELVDPLVFHLFGRFSAAAESVICDDDRLELLHALHDDALRPKRLFDALRESHLLMLGCSLPDWAARFFLRAAKSERLSARSQPTFEYLVGADAAADVGLRDFLSRFSRETQLLPWSAPDFIAELRQRWEQRHPPGAAAPAEAAPAPAAGAGPLPGSVFISYSRADLAAARQLARAFEAAHIDTWFDAQELEPGDDWALKIRRGIRDCALFVPVVSADTQSPESRRRYFWHEWNAADERARGMAPGEPFILPVGIDELDPYRADVPERFERANWTRLPGGVPTPDFVDRVLRLYRDLNERAARPRRAG